MTVIRHLLCPIDFSPASLRAFQHATAIAGRTGASVLALHVFNAPLALRTAFPQYAGSMLDSGARTRLIDRLDDVAAPARERGVAISVRVREGDIVEEILDAARSPESDLIVMGTHGRSGVPRLVLGSVTERLLHRASCPVLTVPPVAADAPTGAAPQFAKILCCVDFSAESLAALHKALTLAREFEAAISLLHVLEWSPEDVRGVTESVDTQAVWERQNAEVRARLGAALPDDQAVRQRVSDIVVMHGKPYDAILRHAADGRFDLVVMGAGHRTGLERIIGSTTDRVVRAAGCPVLVVRQ